MTILFWIAVYLAVALCFGSFLGHFIALGNPTNDPN